MQIKLENVSYKNLKELTFEIENEKITGINSKEINDLVNINYLIGNNINDIGIIKYSKKFFKDKIGIISISNLSEMINGTAYEYLNINNINNSLLELLNLNISILNRQLITLSNTEKIKLMFLKILNFNYDTLLIDGILEKLDSEEKTNFIKLIINLKKFQKKTIVISSTDIDLIYEFVDNLVLIVDKKSYQSKDKFSLYDNNLFIEQPFIKKIEKMIYNKSNINVGNNESINELIKAIYREVR